MRATATAERIGPRQGSPQEAFLSSPADIAIYGGARGAGKTYALLLEPIRHHHVRGFTCVTFRRVSTQIRALGSLWDESSKLYPVLGGQPREQALEWRFPVGAAFSFAHLQHENDKQSWLGAQICLMQFDQLEQFSKSQFFFLLGSNRSVCGVRPYVRGTCNPDPDSWLAEFIAWWIGDDGFPIPDRAGRLRWMLRAGDDLHWFDSRGEAMAARPALKLPEEVLPKSVTFVPGTVHDNPDLLEADPGYLATLHALPLIERERFLKGNWKIRPSAGNVFNRIWFPTVDAAVGGGTAVRVWDLAATEPSTNNPDPDWTVGARVRDYGKKVLPPRFLVEDVVRIRASDHVVERTILNTASQDGKDVTICLFRDPAQAGKWQSNYLVRQLAGYKVRVFPISGDKLTLAGPARSQAEVGNIALLRGAWNEPFLSTLHGFTGSGKEHDDDVDVLAGAINAFTDQRTWGVS